jgi:hypothetical protein
MMEVLDWDVSRVKDYRHLGCVFTQALRINNGVITSIKPLNMQI